MLKDINSVYWPALHGRSFENCRVLVTGGAGFIGSHLAGALAELGASVVVLDDLSGGSRENLRAIPPVEFIEGSILNQDLLAQVIKGCRYVYHEAALGSVPRSVEHPRLYNDVNITGTLNVLEAARHARVSRVIFAASSSAYGDNPVPWIETMPVMPRSPYAATKVADEALLRAYSMSYGLDTASLRYFNIFGPRQNANSAYAAVIAAFAKSLINGESPVIFGDGEQSRDFTFVANAVHANLLAARAKGPIAGQVMNVGCGAPITVMHLARVMADALDRPDLKPICKPPRAGDMKHSFADLTRSRAALGYQPIVDFSSGLKQTIAWYRQVIKPSQASMLAAAVPQFAGATSQPSYARVQQ
jgi:nucleoside-diphosphate-sugar epimerase